MKFVIFHNNNDGTLETEPPWPGAELEEFTARDHMHERRYRGWRIDLTMETFQVFLDELRVGYGFAYIGADDYGPYIALDGWGEEGDTRISEQEDAEIRRWGRWNDWMVFRRDRLKFPPTPCDVEILSEIRLPETDLQA